MSEYQTRKTIRLKNYDYSQNGAYFVTICAHNRDHLFGRIVADDASGYLPMMVKSAIGQIIFAFWDRIGHFYENVRPDMFCVMPNHIHGIIIIEDMDRQERPSLQKIIQGFKSITTRRCFSMGYKKIWQRSYHDHIIRNEIEY